MIPVMRDGSPVAPVDADGRVVCVTFERSCAHYRFMDGLKGAPMCGATNTPCKIMAGGDGYLSVRPNALCPFGLGARS